MAASAYQPCFDDLGTHLSQVTFVVVDLETTGGGEADAITEVGAVKVRGGEVLAEFQTLINPSTQIPPLIAVLTGITNQLVAGAPRLSQVLPSFLEFARDSVLVAHNAPFDVGFLKRACAQLDYAWPGNKTLDTVALARQVLLRDEVPNCKLATLARHFHSGTEPVHRALADARATVDVLHGLLERVGSLGVQTLEDLNEFTHRVSPQRRAKRTWAAKVPSKPGVYFFYAQRPAPAAGSAGGDGIEREVLYVGTSNNLQRRVRSYFTSAEKRPRIDEMVRVASGVDWVVCATALHAEVIELRMIATHAPRYNRRSKFPQRLHWLKLTKEAYPRLSRVQRVAADEATYFGPFRGRQGAEDVMNAVYEAYPIRRCTARLSKTMPSSPCALAGMQRCCSPCDFTVSLPEYAELVDQVRAALHQDVRPVLTAARTKLQRLVEQERFEEAVSVRVRLETWTHATRRFHRITSVAACPQIIAALHTEEGWEIHLIRYGRLAGAAVARTGEDPRAIAAEVVRAGETVLPPVPPLPAATIEETERIAAWLERPGVRLMEIEGDWAWPVHGAIAEDALPGYALGEVSGAAARYDGCAS